MSKHGFCRALLTNLMVEVREKVPAKLVKEAWAYGYNDGCCEFQIPSVNFYWYGQSCCLWYAKFQGWSEYLRTLESETEGR